MKFARGGRSLERGSPTAAMIALRDRHLVAHWRERPLCAVPPMPGAGAAAWNTGANVESMECACRAETGGCERLLIAFRSRPTPQGRRRAEGCQRALRLSSWCESIHRGRGGRGRVRRPPKPPPAPGASAPSSQRASAPRQKPPLQPWRRHLLTRRAGGLGDAHVT